MILCWTTKADEKCYLYLFHSLVLFVAEDPVISCLPMVDKCRTPYSFHSRR
jgi:hypothetical protein